MQDPSPHESHGDVERVRRDVSVLVVDDDTETRVLLFSILEHAGYTVEMAANGRDALALLRSVRPALILLDVWMPIMDGYQFRQAQRRDRELLAIPTIVITAGAADPFLDVAVEDTLKKPFGRAQLLRIVQRYVKATN